MNNLYKKAAEILKHADGVLITAANGFSITEGINLFAANGDFISLFGDLNRKYGLSRLIEGMSAGWPNANMEWGFWSRMINHYSLNYTPGKVMTDLKGLVADKDYFILTTNGEGHFAAAGFDVDKIYEIEGNWLTMQCSAACHDGIYPAEEAVKAAAEREKGGIVSDEAVPLCPHCGRPMKIRMDGGYGFVKDKKAEKAYNDFMERYKGKNLAVLELGVGFRNNLVKIPIMEKVAANPDYRYISINYGQVSIPPQIRQRSVGIDDTISAALEKIAEETYNGKS